MHISTPTRPFDRYSVLRQVHSLLTVTNKNRFSVTIYFFREGLLGDKCDIFYFEFNGLLVVMEDTAYLSTLGEYGAIKEILHRIITNAQRSEYRVNPKITYRSDGGNIWS